MDWVLINIKVMDSAEEILTFITPLQYALLFASLVMVILTFIKDKRSRWLASALAVMIIQLFSNLFIYCNGFDVVFSKISFYRHLFNRVTSEEFMQTRNYLVGAVLFLDIAFIFLYCMHFIRNYKVGVIHMIAAFAASITTRITGYFSTIVAPTYGPNITERRTSTELLSLLRSFTRHYFKDRILRLTTTPRLLGMAVVIILFVLLITLSIETKKYDTKRKMLFVFPTAILIIEVIRYIAIAMCQFYFEAIADLRFGAVNLIACVICLVWAVYLFKTRGKTGESRK